MRTLQENVMYLSPHLDDAVLSCGGLMHRQVKAGTRVVLVTVFAGVPAGGALSEFAAELHADWGLPTNTVATRRKEDEQAVRVLGAEYLHLDYPDAIYRSDETSFLYLSNDDLFGTVHPSDLKLVEQIRKDVVRVHSALQATIYAPLAVGGHVDHLLVRETALALNRISCPVNFYEDYPYVEYPGALTRELERMDGGRWTDEAQELDDEDLALKIEAIAAYSSQMVRVFRTVETMAERVRDYAWALSPGERPTERYWRLSPKVKSPR